jgi:hypothetical protein
VRVSPLSRRSLFGPLPPAVQIWDSRRESSTRREHGPGVRWIRPCRSSITTI